MKPTCPHCGNDDESMLEEIGFTARDGNLQFKGIVVIPGELTLRHCTYTCTVCSKEFTVECN